MFRTASLCTLVAILGLAACQSTSEDPDPTCDRGVLAVGDTVTGSLNAKSCIHDDGKDNGFGYSTMPFESWSVHLVAGKAYMFHLKQIADPARGGLNDIDAFLELHAAGDPEHSDLLATSGNEAGGVTGYDSEFWFIAPISGDFTVIAASYYEDKLGGYRLTMNECPVLGVLDTAGTYTFTRPSSSCLRHTPGYDSATTLSFVGVDAAGYETFDFGLSHSSSDMRAEFGGPGFDTYAHLSSEAVFVDGYWSFSEQNGMYPGRMTLALGTESFNAAGTYTIEFDRHLPPASPPKH